MREIIFDAPVRWWHCPTCDTRDRTQQPGVHTQFHHCPALGGVALPMIEVRSCDANADGRQVVVEREDYIGRSNASPVSAVNTERGDGSNDCTVFPTVATTGTTAS